jgi:septal ring factor EnvC (AmiA/AmiB activator)
VLLVAFAASAHAAERPGAKGSAPITPRPRPALKSDNAARKASSEDVAPMDLSHALPGASLATMPSSQQQLGALKQELAKNRPLLAGAKAKSESLASEAAALRQKLIATAARIQELEREQSTLATQVTELQAQDDALASSFAADRVSVTRLLAILERLQHDMPPALAVRPDDALAAARGAMLVGASLPPVYARAADLARRIEKLKATRTALITRRNRAILNSAALAKAHSDLETLSAQKDLEAAGAADLYTGLATRLDRVARQAADFAALVTKVNALRKAQPDPAQASIVTVTAQSGSGLKNYSVLAKGSLLEPVAGTSLPAGPENDKNPGLTYATVPGAQVIAPADGKILFAGPYHKEGQVLILEITTGYDIVLAGLGRVTVRPGDELLAGEPVGIMPAASGSETRLYFELRQNGKGLDPEPWLMLAMRKAKKT